MVKEATVGWRIILKFYKVSVNVKEKERKILTQSSPHSQCKSCNERCCNKLRRQDAMMMLML